MCKYLILMYFYKEILLLFSLSRTKFLIKEIHYFIKSFVKLNHTNTIIWNSIWTFMKFFIFYNFWKYLLSYKCFYLIEIYWIYNHIFIQYNPTCFCHININKLYFCITFRTYIILIILASKSSTLTRIPILKCMFIAITHTI